MAGGNHKAKYRGFIRLRDATWWGPNKRKLSTDPEWNKWLLECEANERRRHANGGCF